MKTWHWVLLGGGAIVVIYLISRSKPTTGAGAQNPTTNNIAAIGAGIGGVIAGIFSSGKKVQPPAGGNVGPGNSTAWDPSGSALDPSRSNKSDPFGLGLTDPGYAGQASGGTDVGGGLTAAQPTNNAFGIPNLTAPNFSIGTEGANFAAN